PQVSAVVGIHPNYCSQAAPDDFARIEALVSHPRVVGIGETGLDKYWDFAPIDIQREFFVRHIKLSQECRKPFVVHCRDAEPETLEVLREMAEQGSLNGVMHSFCGSANTRDACLELGMNFSVGGMVTYKKNVELREIISGIPLDRLMLETDCPYLSPIPVRGQRNEPAYVAHTAKCLGDVFGLSPVEIGNITTENARRVFSLSE
ncbi:MAG: TatD family hydrolase, partial [Planctomycetaceae bacterium]|nr:TatD family hydrolase [Planctomycetaceae bacterium]